MGRGKNRRIPDNQNESTKNLRALVNKLQKENKRLKSEIQTLESAFRKSNHFLRDNTEDIDLRKLIKGARKDKSLKELSNKSEYCEVCQSEFTVIKLSFQSTYLCKHCGNKKVVKNNGHEEREDEDNISSEES